jgi:hypothetical protein
MSSKAKESLAVEKKKQVDIVLKNIKLNVKLVEEGKQDEKVVVASLEPLAMDVFDLYKEGGQLKDLPTPPPFNTTDDLGTVIFTLVRYINILNNIALDYDNKKMKE